MPTEILVYLDSSDYSVLSDPKRRSAETDLVLARLLEFSQSEKVRFVYSAAAICEMAPQDSLRAGYAEARANLLSLLCRRNAFFSFERMIAGEAAQIKSTGKSMFSPLSDNGDWFPEMTGFVSPVDLVETFKNEMEKLKSGLNRKQRRAAESRTFRNGSLRGTARESLGRGYNQNGFNELLSVYPMKPEAAEIMWDYVTGAKTRKDAEEAFLESLRDPKWMMRWFYNHHDKLSPIVTWLRGPSEKAALVLRDAAVGLREIARGSDLGDLALVIRKGRADLVQSIWTSVAEKVTQQKLQPCMKEIEERSPGLNVMLNAYYAVFADSALTNREVKSSDFADVVHAAYSPYVDIFRADRYMAPHIQTYVKKYGTRVVSKLTDLPKEIEAAIALL